MKKQTEEKEFGLLLSSPRDATRQRERECETRRSESEGGERASAEVNPRRTVDQRVRARALDKSGKRLRIEQTYEERAQPRAEQRSHHARIHTCKGLRDLP